MPAHDGRRRGEEIVAELERLGVKASIRGKGRGHAEMSDLPHSSRWGRHAQQPCDMSDAYVCDRIGATWWECMRATLLLLPTAALAQRARGKRGDEREGCAGASRGIDSGMYSSRVWWYTYAAQLSAGRAAVLYMRESKCSASHDGRCVSKVCE